MSLVSEFARIASQIGFERIGAENITIGAGTAVEAILNEIRVTKSYTEGGREIEKALEAVIRREDWDAASYPASGASLIFQKVAVWGENLRVSSVDVGVSFVRVGMQEIGKA